MNRFLLGSLELVGVIAFLTGCSTAVVQASAAPAATNQKPAASDVKAVAFLKSAMDKYSSFGAFNASVVHSTSTLGSASPGQTREISYVKPNIFRVVSTRTGMIQTVISDGKSEIEYDNLTGQAARKTTAPDSIAAVSSMQMMHPMFNGTLLYQFFGGSGNLDGLVDSDKGAVTFGKEEKAANGELSHEVKFYGKAQYGHVTALIGEKSLFVYRIKYDSEPLVKMMSDPNTMKMIQGLAETASKMGKDSEQSKAVKDAVSTYKPPANMSMDTTEDYKTVSIPASIPMSTFKVEAPSGSTSVNVPVMPRFNAKPPIPIGSQAPDFTVTRLDGKPTKLSALRGHPVMIDFWATWCGPCVAGLPHTQEVFQKGSPKGLQVLAISDEERAPVSGFISDHKYGFPTYIDKLSSAEKMYKIEAIPTTVVIDATGKLVAYIVGGGQDEAIASALKKVGITL